MATKPIGKIPIQVKDGQNNYATVDLIERTPVECVGWAWVWYQNKRYQLFGGVRVPYFINVKHPL